jgi:hypothetical protein
MALQKQNIPMSLGQGIDTKTDEKLVPPTKLLVLENGYIDKFGTLSKRNGYDALGTPPSGGRSITTFQDELILLTNEKIYSFNNSEQSWLDKGYVSDVKIESAQVVRNTSFQNASSSATLNNIIVYAWEDTSLGLTTVRSAIYDLNTRVAISSDESVEALTSSRPRVIACLRYIYIFYTQGTNLKSCRIDTSLSIPALETPVTLSTSGAADIVYDVVRYSTGSNMVLAYKNSSNGMNIGYVVESGNFGGPSDGVPSAITDVFSIVSGGRVITDYISIISEDGGSFKLIFGGSSVNGANDVYYGSLNYDFTSVTKVAMNKDAAIVKNNAAVIRETSNIIKVWLEYNDSDKSKVYIQFFTVTGLAGAATVSATSSWIKSLGIVSKPFTDSSDNVYLICAFETTLQPTYFVMKHIDSTRALVVNTISKTEAYGLTNRKGLISEPFESATDERIWPSTIRYQLQIVNSQVTAVTGIQSNKIFLSNVDSIESRTLGKNLHITNGQVQDYDGQSVVEHGFHYYPENLSFVSTSTASTPNSAGTRNYVAVYQWIDKQGQLHQSTASIPFVQVNGAGYESNTIRVPTLRVTEKRSGAGRTSVFIGLYRTIPNGTIFYSVLSTIFNTANSSTVDYVDIIDGSLDTTIISNPILYTTGGILDNSTPNPSNVIEVYNNRLILAEQSDANLIQFSKSYVNGSPVEFSGDLSFRVDQGEGAVKALGRLDEKLILFKDTSIYAQVGSGPTPTGAQNDFGTPVLISSDVGCSDPQSVVMTKNGLMFKSNKGYYLLNRSLQTEYIGQDVHAYNSLTVTGAVVIPDLDQVRIVHSDGLCLVYNYLYKEWYTFTNLEANACTVWQNTFIILKTDNNVWQESSDYTDDGTYIQMKLQTAWIQTALLQGAQRIYGFNVIGKYISKHAIEINLRYDFDESVRETQNFDTANVIGSSYYGQGAYYGADPYYGGVDSVEQFRVRPAVQKCEAIKIELRDYDSEITDGGGLELTGLTLQVGVKSGLFKLQDVKNASSG